ncbi:hypothetical protein LPJ61_002908 [Coemansia biformis]|uniref:Autophagy-related protein 4 n=1 Tax=Coemansia biformis TaxID=1286918 RepID=A0A9W8CZ55_9FUNG|nr:hypothetical protein LPJ61_002908 [Coemansia biformis]
MGLGAAQAQPSAKFTHNQRRFSPLMNRQHRSATVGGDKSPPREIPEAAFARGSPLARNRANRRRSTLHDALERTKTKQLPSPPPPLQPQQQQQPPRLSASQRQKRTRQQRDLMDQDLKVQGAATLHSSSSSIGKQTGAEPLTPQSPQSPLSANGRPLSMVSAYEALALPHDSGMALVRTVHRAELQVRRPTQPADVAQVQPDDTAQTRAPEPTSEPAPALSAPGLELPRRASRSSLMHRRAEKALATSRGSRESMERGCATPRESADRLWPMQPLAAAKRAGGGHPFRVERTYRVADRKDSDSEDGGGASDRDAETSPPSSPLSATFALPAAQTLPPVQTPPPQKTLPPLPEKLQQQLQQLPRLSPPRKLPLGAKPSLRLGLPDAGLPLSPALGSRGSDRRVVSGSSILRSPSKVSFADTQSAHNMHMLGPEPPVSARVGKGQASEAFRRFGYWLYTTAPVQFIKHAIVEERGDSVNVLFSTDRSIWILGVSYRLKKTTRSVMLPAAIDADGSHLQAGSSLFLSHLHQKRSASPSRTQRARKQDAAPQRRAEDAASNRRRANTSGAMMNKKKLQGLTQMQTFAGLPPVPDVAALAKHGLRPLASIPSQDILQPKLGATQPISPMPFPDDPSEEPARGLCDADPDADAACAGRLGAVPPPPLPLPPPMPHAQREDRPKSSRMGRLRSWVSRTAKPMRRRSDVASEDPAMDIGAVSSVSLIGSRPSSPPQLPPPPLQKQQQQQPQQRPPLSQLKQKPPLPPLPQPLTRLSAESQMPSTKGIIRSASSTSTAVGSDSRALGIAPRAATGPLLQRKSKEALSVVSSEQRSWNDSELGLRLAPPVPRLGDRDITPASASVHGPGLAARHPGVHAAAAAALGRPMSSHSNAASQRRVASSSSGGGGGAAGVGPNRRESAVRALVSEFAEWESPAASIMMFQREWKLPSFQQLVSIQSATAWAKEGGWSVTLSSETFFMAHIFYNLPIDPTAQRGPALGDKFSGDRLLLRMRLAMEDIEGQVLAGEVWRDSLTAIILTIDARIAPKCLPASGRAADAAEPAAQPDGLSPEDHIKRMRVLEKHLAKATDSFAARFWPRQDDLLPVFNTYPRRRTDEVAAAAAERRMNRRTRGWKMIPTLLTFRQDEQPAHVDKAQPERSESPTLSTFTKKRHLYPMGLSIAGGGGSGGSENPGASGASMHEMSAGDSPVGTPDHHSPSQSRLSSRLSSPAASPPSKSPVLSPRAASPSRNRSSAYSQLSAGGVRPASPVHKRGTLGLHSSNDVTTLSDEFGSSLGITPKPPRHTTSSQSSGASSGYNVHGNFSSTSIISRQPTDPSVAGGGHANPSQLPPQPQRKRDAGEAGIVGRTKGGFEVVWSATDTLSTSYVMVPVPKAASPESPAKVLKQKHSRLDPTAAAAAAATDGDSTGTQSQPNLKRVLESITREINLDSSYVLLLPPPPPIAMDDDDCGSVGGDNDEFGYLATTLLRRVKSEIVMRRTLQEFEFDYGLDLVDDDDGGDSDSFQMVGSEGGSSRNSVYFSAEDDAAQEPETWYKRLSGSSSQHHLPQRHLRQPEPEAAQPQPLSLNQLTLLEFFLDCTRRFYFTYRRGFPTITPSFYTSDMGWGCTYRTCQMMLAESFARVMLGRFWDPFRLSPLERTRHGRVTEWFHDADTPHAFYSIHRMARTATEMDKRIGDWLGPSIAAHVMKRLSIKHSGCPLTIHVAIDQTVYASEVRRQALPDAGSEQPSWRPLLLLVPVRLGLSRLNLGYVPKIKTLFQIPQSVGLVGGKPSRSFYFVGRQGDSLFYLDPHVTRQHVPRSGTLGGCSEAYDSGTESDSSEFEMFGIADTDEYHTTHISSMPIQRLDPSMLLGFLFNTEAEWDAFVMAATDKESQRSICTGTSPLFTLLSGSSMMTPQFETVVQPLSAHPSKAAAALDAGGGRLSPRVNSDSQVKSPRVQCLPAAGLPAAPSLARARSASSPRFPTAEASSLVDTLEDNDEFEML